MPAPIAQACPASAVHSHSVQPSRKEARNTAPSLLQTLARAGLAVLLLAPATQAVAALSASVTLNAGKPTNIYPGEVTELRITLSNSNPASAVNNVAFSNSLPGTLPNGLKVAGTPTYTCTDPSGPSTSAGTGTLTAVAGTQTVALTGGVIPARANNTDGSCNIIIPVTAGTSSGGVATYTYLIASGAVTGNDGAVVANSGAVNQSVNVNALAKPTLAKSFGSSTLILGGATTTLTVTVSNSNPVPIPNFSIVDAFPQLGGAAIIKVAAVPGASASCNNGGAAPAFNPVAGATSITGTGTVPAKSGAANGSCSFTVSVEAAHTNSVYSPPAQTNTISATSDFSNDLGIPAAANATASVTVKSPLRVAKAFAHASLASGQTDSLTITLYNDGSNPLTITSLADDPIDGIGNAAYGLKVTGGATTCAGGITAPTAGATGINLTGGTIPANGSCTVTVTFTGTVQTAGTPISYTNTLAQGAVGVATPGVVSQSISASLLVADDLRVTKAATPATAAPGNPVKYTVTVQNYSPAAINNVAIRDNLLNGLTFLTGTINGNNYTPALSGTGCSGLAVTGATGDASPVFTIATLPARSNANTAGSCSITFWAMTSPTAANGSSTGNSIKAGDVCYGSGATCNGGDSVNTSTNRIEPTSGTVTTTVLSASKNFNPVGPLSEGTISTMTITLTNQSANPLTDVSISDNLPMAASGGQLRIASPANAATTCGSPTITAAPGSSSLTMNGGTVPARASNGTGTAGTCFIKVDVIGPAGSYPNTATAAATETYSNGTTHSVGPVSTNTATLIYNSALSAAKTFSPASVSSGGRSTVRVRLNNTGAVALTNVSVTDPLPAGMVLASPANAYTTCAGASSTTAVSGAGSASMSSAAIAGGGGCEFLFDVVVTGSANWVNTIPAGNITADGGVRNVLAVSGTLNYSAPTSLSVATSTNPSTLTFPGQVSQLSVTITNGSQAVTNLRLTDYFTANGTAASAPNGMIVAPTPGVSTNCPGGVVSAVAGGSSVAVSGVALAADASCTVNVNVTSSAVGGITNYIPAGAIVTDQGLSNNGQATTSLATQSNIGVVKQFTPNVVAPGERSRLRITFLNPTNMPMANLAVTDTLPAGVTVPSGANPVSTCAGAAVSAPTSGQVQVTGGSIAAASGGVSASCYAEIDVLPAAQGDYVNTIPAGGVTASAGGSPATNSQPTSDTLRAKASLIVHKAIALKTLDTGNPYGFTTGSAVSTPGTAVTLTIRLDNPNAAPLTGAAFTDALPAGLVVAAVPNAATTCTGGTVVTTPSAISLRLAGGTIPASGYCTVTVDVLSNISGTYTSGIASGGVTTSEGVVNAEATTAQLVVSTPPTVRKQFAPAVIYPNGTSTLTIFLGNDNSSAITLSSALTDTLPMAPGNLVVAPVPNIAKTCPGTVTAAAGSGTVTYASGATIPAGGCSISVNVTGATSGEHINTIPAGALQTSLGNNQQPANAALAISTMGYVAGKVFKDNSLVPNGSYDSGVDAPIAGASIELHGGSTCGGALIASTTTDALGNYLFAGLTAGTYSVCEPVQPTGTVNGIASAGGIVSSGGSTGTRGTPANPTASTSQITGIVLNGDGSAGAISGSDNNNFAEVVLSEINGTVFFDQNNNGVQNGADTGIAGVAIELLNNTGSVMASTATDAAGQYRFTGLQPGTYSVRQPAQPAGSSNGLTVAGVVLNGGTAGTASAPTALPSVIANLALPPNTVATGNNFAELPNGRTLSGRIFLDYNNDGLTNGGDHGIGGQTVELAGTDINGNPVTASAATAADGTYTFANLPEGSYTATQPSQPTGTVNGITTAGSTGGTATATGITPSRIASISLTGANTVSANNNFAEAPGPAPDLAIAKTHSPVSFGAGAKTGYYTITVSNIGAAATTAPVTVVDTLPAGMSPVELPAGAWTCSSAAPTVSCTSNAVIAAGTSAAPLVLRVAVASGLAGQILTNTATVAGGGEPVGFDGNNSASDPTVISDAATVQGTVWGDANHNRALDAGEKGVAGWMAELLLNGVVVDSARTGTNGGYAFGGIAPGSGYQIRFRNPDNGIVYGRPVPNESATAFANGVVSTANPGGADNADGTLQNLVLLAGANIAQQSLPLDPSGVVYDAVTRKPVSGATVTLSAPGLLPSHVVGNSLTQTTGADGSYQFLLLAGAPAGSTVYTLAATPPAGYLPTQSALIPPCAVTLAVGSAPPDAALVQNSNLPPPNGMPAHDPAACPTASGALAGGAGTTQYYTRLSFASLSGASNLVNNHIPVDPILGGAIFMTKNTPLVNVARGDLVPYTVTATNTLAAGLTNISLQDVIPAGFRYRSGSATLNGSHVEPAVSGRTLSWPNQSFAAGERKTLKLILLVGSGVGEGEYVNQAWSINSIVDSPVSNIASASVRVVPDPTFDCSDIIGKVFDDRNANGYQDKGEPGIANVRVVTARGLLVTTDAEGRFHVACAAIPQADRGSNFVMKLDDRSLPSGYRITTENPRAVRVTTGKMAKINFGATVHRVVRLELGSAAFVDDGTELQPPYAARLDQLIAQLKARPSVLRIAYRRSGEPEASAKRRLEAVTQRIQSLWQARGKNQQKDKEADSIHPLVIESEMEEVK
ncbi:SdrD B-like domain-containing protein [Noviherbaspirillum massiliense]|uniref:DUF7933 domain-containing protein n=1 Tax=Noviherbaspirillum massiliense TaxID=1465823 RepID=UPI0002FE3DE0|nr:SdrD B-like domain-containing protein [Noviherbaspirillum massiliense]